MNEERALTLFAGSDRVAVGGPAHIARSVVRLRSDGDQRQLLAFDDRTGAQVDIDLRDAGISSGPYQDQAAGKARIEPPAPSHESKPARKAGRPKLGVEGHEVMLLPRHWEWLSAQPGGASSTLRRLVEQARRDGEATDRARRSQGAVHSFISAIAGNQPGYEEALRALYANDQPGFLNRISSWPSDVRAYAITLAAEAFPHQAK